MCDYSLAQVSNRLAQEGEELVTHRFPTGSLGLASPSDIARCKAWKNRECDFWQAFREFFHPPLPPTVPAVCIPPYAKLTLNNIPQRIQGNYGVGDTEHVTFIQLSMQVNSYRDAFQFSNGKSVCIQELRDGMTVTVNSLEHATEREPVIESVFVRRH